MKIIYHLKDAPKCIQKNEFSKSVLQSILLDLFHSDCGNMGSRCKVHILEHNESLRYENHFRLKPVKLEGCQRTFYIRTKHTNICEYKKQRSKTDDKSNKPIRCD